MKEKVIFVVSIIAIISIIISLTTTGMELQEISIPPESNYPSNFGVFIREEGRYVELLNYRLSQDEQTFIGSGQEPLVNISNCMPEIVLYNPNENIAYTLTNNIECRKAQERYWWRELDYKEVHSIVRPIDENLYILTPRYRLSSGVYLIYDERNRRGYFFGVKSLTEKEPEEKFIQG